MFKRFTPVTHSNIWTRPRGAPSATRFIGTSVIGVMRQGPASPRFSVLPSPPFRTSSSFHSLFPSRFISFHLSSSFVRERRVPTTERNDDTFDRPSTPWHLPYDSEVSRCRSSDSGFAATLGHAYFPRRNAPLISRAHAIDQINDRIKEERRRASPLPGRRSTTF